MNTSFEKKAGYALLLFTLLMTFTMVLHPAGGGISHLLQIKVTLISTHAVALLSLPFAGVGCWGLTKRLGTENFFAVTGFAFIAFGLLAVSAAATANGLILPIFLQKYAAADNGAFETIQPLLRYNFAVNTAYDYIYTVAFCLAIIFWSIAILKTKRFNSWLAWTGIAIACFALLITIGGVAANSLSGFRIFVSALLIWIFLVGMSLVRISNAD